MRPILVIKTYSNDKFHEKSFVFKVEEIIINIFLFFLNYIFFQNCKIIITIHEKLNVSENIDST